MGKTRPGFRLMTVEASVEAVDRSLDLMMGGMKSINHELEMEVLTKAVKHLREQGIYMVKADEIR